jgi:hypothetical protein
MDAYGGRQEVAHMNLGLRGILLIVAVICFVLAAIGFGLGSISLVPLGLALFAAAFLVADGGINLRR